MLPVRRVQDLDETPTELLWMIVGLWTAGAVGIVGGEPKSYKSFLALDLAVAVASGAPCLRRFEVSLTGRVLIYAAEDSPGEVRRRLKGIALAAGVDFESLDIHIITVPVLRLDRLDDREELYQTVATLRPRLLILDPLVRLHGGDENAVADMAPLLAYLRQLQRALGVAVLLVHHARKGGAHLRAGQALRGSSELHAWGDSNLYVRRKGAHLRLTPEHRTAPSGEDVWVELVVKGAAVALAVRTTPVETTSDEVTPSQRVEQALSAAASPLSQRQLRSLCKMQAAKLCEVLKVLVKSGRASKTAAGYVATGRDQAQQLLFPAISGELKGNGNGKRIPA
jgi:hypothetical protein